MSAIMKIAVAIAIAPPVGPTRFARAFRTAGSYLQAINFLRQSDSQSFQRTLVARNTAGFRVNPRSGVYLPRIREIA